MHAADLPQFRPVLIQGGWVSAEEARTRWGRETGRGALTSCCAPKAAVNPQSPHLLIILTAVNELPNFQNVNTMQINHIDLLF